MELDGNGNKDGMEVRGVKEHEAREERKEVRGKEAPGDK